MVWGWVASSEDLAGATSGLKAVPVTTTVSTVVDTDAAITLLALPAATTLLGLACANCWAWDCPAQAAPANKAIPAVE